MSATPQAVDLRSPHFQKLYDAFYSYFVGQLQKDSSAVNKFKLHLSTEFFDDLDLYKKVSGVFSEANTNPAEKKAVARAALWDALVTHAFGTYLATTSQVLFSRVDELEAKIHGICEGKQASEGPNQGVQKQNYSLGS
jgi:hypothetical protein